MNIIVIDTINEYRMPWLFRKINRRSGIQILIEAIKQIDMEIALLTRFPVVSPAIEALSTRYKLTVVNRLFYADAWKTLLEKTAFDNTAWVDSCRIFTDAAGIAHAFQVHEENKYDHTLGTPAAVFPQIISGTALAKTCAWEKVFPKNYPQQFNIGKYHYTSDADNRKLACWTDYFKLKAQWPAVADNESK